MLSRNKDGTADGMDVKVVENADNCVHITMPAAPAGHLTLSDEELSNAAGGCWLGENNAATAASC